MAVTGDRRVEKPGREERDPRRPEGAAWPETLTWGPARALIVALPLLVLLAASFLVETRQRERDRLGTLAAEARLASELIDQRLGNLLELTDFCVTSPSLVRSLDLPDLVDNCGRYAQMMAAWIVVIELGETHTQILNTRARPGVALPAYPRSEEHATLLDLEARSRASGRAHIADVFSGPVAGTGILAAGRYLQLGDGRPAMLYVGTEVDHVSDLLASRVVNDNDILTLVDGSHRIAARSRDIDRYLFADAPAWMADVRREGHAGTRLKQPRPEAMGGVVSDIGYHPLTVVPGWMAVAARDRPESVWPTSVTALPLGLALLGVLLSGLALWGIGFRDRAVARVAVAERARAEAERSNREKSRLLAALAHDIRGPAVSLLGALELAEERAVSPSPETRTARRSAEALLQLVDDILELSFLGSGRLTFNPSPVDLQQLAAGLIERLQGAAGQKGLTLRLEMQGPQPVIVEVDRLRLEQVLGNLLSNAIKYTDAGTVTLHLALGDSRDGRLELTFAVADTGVGIAPEDIPSVFREFGRLETAATPRPPGTGLGLAICQRILKGMDSELALESTPGVGSRFSFSLRLPVVAGAPSTATARPLDGLTIGHLDFLPFGAGAAA